MKKSDQADENGAVPRWKTLILLCLAVYPTLNIVGLLFAPLLQGWPVWLASMVTLPITMLVVSYFILPWLTHLFRRWLKGR